MEKFLDWFPTVVVPENNVITIIIQIVAFAIIACMIIYIVRLYLRNIELKKDPNNQAEIEENMQKIEKTKKIFLKYGGIIFAVVIMLTIILSNFY